MKQVYLKLKNENNRTQESYKYFSYSEIEKIEKTITKWVQTNSDDFIVELKAGITATLSLKIGTINSYRKERNTSLTQAIQEILSNNGFYTIIEKHLE